MKLMSRFDIALLLGLTWGSVAYAAKPIASDLVSIINAPTASGPVEPDPVYKEFVNQAGENCTYNGNNINFDAPNDADTYHSFPGMMGMLDGLYSDPGINSLSAILINLYPEGFTPGSDEDNERTESQILGIGRLEIYIGADSYSLDKPNKVAHVRDIGEAVKAAAEFCGWDETPQIPIPHVPKPYNYPNPFNPINEETTIKYSASGSGNVRIDIYTIAGGKVRTLQDMANQGNNTTAWDGRNKDGDMVASGVYLGLVYIDNQRISKAIKIAVLK